MRKKFFVTQVESVDTNRSDASSTSRWDVLSNREKCLIVLTVLSAIIFGGLLSGLIAMIITSSHCKY